MAGSRLIQRIQQHGTLAVLHITREFRVAGHAVDLHL